MTVILNLNKGALTESWMEDVLIENTNEVKTIRKYFTVYFIPFKIKNVSSSESFYRTECLRNFREWAMYKCECDKYYIINN